MRGKKLHLLIFVLLGMLLLPNKTLACGTTSKELCHKEISESKSSKKSCHKDSTTKKTSKKSCCDSNNSKDKDNSCGGKCGHSNCTSSTPSVNSSIISNFEIQFLNNSLVLLSEKVMFSYTENLIPSNFSSLWLIPKIS